MKIALIFTAVIFVICFLFFKLFNYPKDSRYKQAYLPIVFLLEAIYAVYYYNKNFYSIISSFDNLGEVRFYADLIFVLICALIMLATKLMLKGSNFYGILCKIFSTNFLSKSSKYNDTFWYFPYVENPMGAKPGVKYLSGFYLFSVFCVGAIVLYNLIAITYKIDYYTQGGLFVFSLPILIELYNFYNTDLTFNVENKVEEQTQVINVETKFDKLWKDYTKNFAESFSVAFITDKTPQADTSTQNNYSVNTILSEFQKGKDIIIEDLDIPNSFYKLSGLLFDSLTKGGNILILTDIPEGRHNVKIEGKDVSMMEIFTDYLSNYLQKNVPASNEVLKLHYVGKKSGSEQFKSRIILSSVLTISQSDVNNIKWFEDLDLLMVVNFQDKGRTSFLQNHRFNLLIDQKNKNFQTVIISSFSQGLQASLTKVWKLDRTCEKRFLPEISPNNHYCILSNFERWHENWLKQATPVGNNPYSGIELSIPAISYGIDKITFLDIANSEIREGIESLGTSRHHITKYDVSQRNLDESIQMNMLPFYMYTERKQQFSIIYDVENNAPNAYYKWMHLGKEDNFSIVISKPYLFKDYFADNIRLFRRTPMLSIEPVPSLSKINLAILLYNLLTEGKLSEQQIKKQLIDYDISLGLQSLPVFLRELFIHYFNFDIEENSRLQVEETVLFTKDGFSKSYLYSLAPFKVSHFPQFAPLRSIKIMDNRGILRFTILKDMLFQNYLPGQKHVFNGRTFEIASYDDGEGSMSIRNLPQFNNNLSYASCYKVNLSKDESQCPIEECSSLNSIDSEFSLLQFESSLEVETDAYYEFRKKYQAIHKSNNQEVVRINLSDKDKQMVKRTHHTCRILKMEWTLNNSDVNIAKIQSSLHVLLFEAFKSFFPYSYQYLIVCSDSSNLKKSEKEEYSQLPWIFPEFSKAPKENCVEIYIFEDTTSDIGILNAIRENYVYIFQYIYDYLCWLSQAKSKREPSGFSNYLNMIEDKFEFLRYGFPKTPSFLGVTLLRDFANTYFPLDDLTKNELKNTRKKVF